MLYRQDTDVFPFNESYPGFNLDSVLMHSRSLRYDRAHGGTAGRNADSNDDANLSGEDAMDITGPGSVGGPGPIRPADVRPAQDTASPSSGIEMPRDEVEISSAARMLEKLSTDPRVREARLAEIQAQIAAGTYETPEKLQAAVIRMLSEIG